MHIRLYIHIGGEMKWCMCRRRHPTEIHPVLGDTSSSIVNILPQKLQRMLIEVSERMIIFTETIEASNFIPGYDSVESNGLKKFLLEFI